MQRRVKVAYYEAPRGNGYNDAEALHLITNLVVYDGNKSHVFKPAMPLDGRVLRDYIEARCTSSQ